MVAIALAVVGLDRLTFTIGPGLYRSLDFGYLALDLFGAIVTVTLALFAHLSRAIDATIHPIAHLTMQVASSWLLPPVLILATWRHQQRLRRNGSDPSWHISSRPLSPNKATR